MITHKTMIALILAMICLVSGCGTTKNQNEKFPVQKQTTTEIAGKAIVKSDTIIENKQEKNNNISSDVNLQSHSYMANKNTKKFHFDYCVSVSQMKESSKEYLNCTHDEAVSQGYKPCKKCIGK